MTEIVVSLNKDERANILTEAKGLLRATNELHDLIKKDELTHAMKSLLPNIMEDAFTKIADSLDYSSDIAKQKTERFAEIKEANKEIQRLREQLGSQKPIDGLPEQLDFLSRKVQRWWNKEGFNHTSDETFTSNGLFRLKFCFMLNYWGSFVSETKETDKELKATHIQSLIDRGFQFAPETSHNNTPYDLIDNDQNRKLLKQLLKSRFPSIQIFEYKNRYLTNDIFIIREIDAIIKDVKDI